MRSIPIDVLRAFVAVVEARGFTRAAEELGRSQPTISLQVKRLEELVEAPLFERATRFELTGIGAVCFDYGKRLLRLHDDMLDEASHCKTPDAMLRVGLASELAARLAPHLGDLRREAKIGTGLEVLTDTSASLIAAFGKKALDIALVVGAETEEQSAANWRAPVRWFGGRVSRDTNAPVPLAIAPNGSALHAAAIEALRTEGRKFEFVCLSTDFTVVAAAASAGLAVAPMIEGLAPEGLRLSADKSLPALPPATLSLLARSPALAIAGRQWLQDIVPNLQPL